MSKFKIGENEYSIEKILQTIEYRFMEPLRIRGLFSSSLVPKDYSIAAGDDPNIECVVYVHLSYRSHCVILGTTYLARAVAERLQNVNAVAITEDELEAARILPDGDNAVVASA